MSFRDRLNKARVSRPINKLRYHLYRDLLLAFPKRRSCNLCGWHGRRFLTYKHRYVLCPKCGSHVRHRLIAAAFSDCDEIRRTVQIRGARILHFSAEYCLGLLFRRRAAAYVRADYATDDCDVRLDFANMRVIADGSFDMVVACDVLEHIADDRAALREARRVLRPGGTAILTVPQFDGEVATLEDPAVTSREARTRVFGQEDHVRNYGADFGRRIEQAGFRVRVVDANDFPPSVVDRHVLRPPVPLSDAYGWNWRRIYFARR